MDGFLNILKPPGMTSAAVVGHVKRMLEKVKVGHAGTLDPEAAGVLPIMVGRAARLFDYLADKEKQYVAEIAFGVSTDTQDAQGKAVRFSDNYPSRGALEAVLPRFVGRVKQTPSAFSAIKQNGRPLYDLARSGETVVVPERTVDIESITALYEMPDHGTMLMIDCGRGTYIRTLCDDIGKALDCPAHMRFLLRTKSGAFDLNTALTLEEAKQAAQAGRLQDMLLPMEMPLGHLPRVDVPNRLWKMAKNGAKMPAGAFDDVPEGAFRLYMNDSFMGIAEQSDGLIRYKTMVYGGE